MQACFVQRGDELLGAEISLNLERLGPFGGVVLCHARNCKDRLLGGCDAFAAAQVQSGHFRSLHFCVRNFRRGSALSEITRTQELCDSLLCGGVVLRGDFHGALVDLRLGTRDLGHGGGNPVRARFATIVHAGKFDGRVRLSSGGEENDNGEDGGETLHAVDLAYNEPPGQQKYGWTPRRVRSATSEPEPN